MVQSKVRTRNALGIYLHKVNIEIISSMHLFPNPVLYPASPPNTHVRCPIMLVATHYRMLYKVNGRCGQSCEVGFGWGQVKSSEHFQCFPTDLYLDMDLQRGSSKDVLAKV